MKIAVADRRVARRHYFKVPLRVRIRKSAIPEQRAESENLSEKGIFFTTDSLLRMGTTVENPLRDSGRNHARTDDGMALHGARRTRRAGQLFAGQVWRWRTVRSLSDFAG